jgi:hypothetical protein
MTQVVCADEKIAIELLAVYEKDVDLGDKLLVRLATRGLCQRAMFTVMGSTGPSAHRRRVGPSGLAASGRSVVTPRLVPAAIFMRVPRSPLSRQGYVA